MKVSSGGTEVPGGPETLSSNASPQLPQVTSLMSGPGGSGGRMFLPPSIQSRESGRTGFRSDSKPCGAPAERAGQRSSPPAGQLFCGLFRAHSGEPSHTGMLADKPALVSIAEDVPRLPPAQRPGFLHGAGEHCHECPEPAGHRPRRGAPRAKRSQRCMAIRRPGRRNVHLRPGIEVRCIWPWPHAVDLDERGALVSEVGTAVAELLTALDKPLPPACTDARSLAT